MLFPDFQPMRVSEEQVCIYISSANPVFTFTPYNVTRWVMTSLPMDTMAKAFRRFFN
jgi:hypothetical protein